MLSSKPMRVSKPLWQLFSKGLSSRNFCDQPKQQQPTNPIEPTIGADIDPKNMMGEDSDDDEYFNKNMLSVDSEIDSKDIDGVNIAPIDINPWIKETPPSPDDLSAMADEPEMKEIISQVPEPPSPTARSGIYEFKGLKILVPKSWMRPETYRYHLDAQDQTKLPDDTRILKFD